VTLVSFCLSELEEYGQAVCVVNRPTSLFSAEFVSEAPNVAVADDKKAIGDYTLGRLGSAW